MTDPRPIVEQAFSRGAACFTCSFQAEDVVVLDHLRRVDPQVPVLFLDTGYHFVETTAYRDLLAGLWKLNLINLTPRLSVEEQEREFGQLYVSAPDRCCGIRKVEPLFAALEGYEVWFTGLRREQSPTRALLQPFGTHTLASGKTLHKVAPLFDWTWSDVWAYLATKEIPHLPLYDRGYTSIGCEPCTALPSGADLRSGRWGGRKLECGIHIESAKAVPHREGG
jgi:phosphoadenosine phosphosulfate reductase